MPTALSRAIRAEMSELADPERARGAQAYMKSAMPYYGLTAGLMRGVCKATFRDVQFKDSKAWQREVRAMWREAEFREERYAAIELTGIRQAKDFQTPDAMPLYEEMIVSGAWWDLVDGIASHRVGPIVSGHPVVMKRLMRQWSRCDDLWKRRTSIICQLGAKRATDLKLLYDCIQPSLNRKEFFLRKAIGWALRQYAWTDPDEVLRYVREKEAELSPLSKREALKNLLR